MFTLLMAVNKFSLKLLFTKLYLSISSEMIKKNYLKF